MHPLVRHSSSTPLLALALSFTLTAQVAQKPAPAEGTDRAAIVNDTPTRASHAMVVQRSP